MSDAKALVIDYLQTVWNDGDIEACDRFLAPYYDIHHDPGDPWDGQTLTLADFKNRVRLSRAPFPDQQFTVTTAVEEAHTVAVAWKWKGTFLNDAYGFAATGAEVQTSGITIYHTDASRISGHIQSVDRLSIFQQLQSSRAP
jgi:predicted ester cyclase